MLSFPDIPRIYTALAEWLACGLMIWQTQTTRIAHKKFGLFVLMGLGQAGLQLFVDQWSVLFWIPGMILNVAWMFLTFIVCSDDTLQVYLYNLGKAFIFAEFIASFSWQIYCYLLYQNHLTAHWLTASFMVISYLLLTLACRWFLNKYQQYLKHAHLTYREIVLSTLTALIIFAVSNIGFMLSKTQFLLGDIQSIFIFRTLINLCGLMLIYIQENQHYEQFLQQELAAIQHVFQSQYEQYEAYRESNQIIHQRFHDLKHQLEIIELEPSQQKRQAYVHSLKKDLQAYQSTIKTGNPIIDVMLTRKNLNCLQQKIQLTTMVEGSLLNFMETMDLCSLLGNSLDNAIESVEKNQQIEQRLINLRISQKASFVLYSIENYCQEAPTFENGLPVTTKTDTQLHGYGLKSLSYIANKYQGTMTVTYEDHWFKLNLLFPIPNKP